MPARTYLTIITAALIGVFAASPPMGAASSTPCERACVKDVEAKLRSKRWVTPQQFTDAYVVVSVFNENGGLLRIRHLKDGCLNVYHGGGIIVKVRACGPEPTHLRFTYRAKRPQRITLAYEAGMAY